MKKVISFSILLFSSLVIFAQEEDDIAHDSLLIEGHYRTFHWTKPRHSHGRLSLLFILHGSGGKGMGIRNSALKLEAISDKENLMIVYPDGYKTFWNECRKAAGHAANIENINDEAFFSAMIDYFYKTYYIDTKKVYAAGMSGGGHMAYKLAITMPDQFKGIAAVVANLPTPDNMDCEESKKPIAVMIINGTADSTNPYNGGEVKTSVKMGTVRSTDQTFQYWATIDGYKGKPSMKKLPDTVADGKSIEQYTYRAKGKPEVTLLKVINGKHEHPADIDAYSEAWKFFKRQK